MPKQRDLETRVDEAKRKLKKLDTQMRIRKLQRQLKGLRK